MRRLVVGTLLSFAVASGAMAHDLDIINKSKTAIHHLYLSPANDSDWGPDQLGDGSKDIIKAGDTFGLTGIARGRFDVKIIAEDETECVIEDANFNEGKEWTITERMLDSCAASK